MELITQCALAADKVVWRHGQGGFAFTVVCKATFELRPNLSPLAVAQEPIVAADVYGGPAGGITAATDLVPFKKRPEVMIIGHVYAPEGRQVTSLNARVSVGEIDKTIQVVGDRDFCLDGRRSDPTPFSRVALSWDRAAGGPDTSNPAGVRIGEGATADFFGRITAPNFYPAGFNLTGRNDVVHPVCFAPIAPLWPSRAMCLYRHASGWDPKRWNDRPLPEIDLAYFNAAPSDQQRSNPFGDDVLYLEYLHPRAPQLSTRLAAVTPVVTADMGGGPQAVQLRCDTLVIDTDRGLASLVWRAHLLLERPDRPVRIVVATPNLPTQAPGWNPNISTVNAAGTNPAIPPQAGRPESGSLANLKATIVPTSNVRAPSAAGTMGATNPAAPTPSTPSPSLAQTGGFRAAPSPDPAASPSPSLSQTGGFRPAPSPDPAASPSPSLSQTGGFRAPAIPPAPPSQTGGFRAAPPADVKATIAPNQVQSPVLPFGQGAPPAAKPSTAEPSPPPNETGPRRRVGAATLPAVGAESVRALSGTGSHLPFGHTPPGGIPAIGRSQAPSTSTPPGGIPAITPSGGNPSVASLPGAPTHTPTGGLPSLPTAAQAPVDKAPAAVPGPRQRVGAMTLAPGQIHAAALLPFAPSAPAASTQSERAQVDTAAGLPFAQSGAVPAVDPTPPPIPSVAEYAPVPPAVVASPAAEYTPPPAFVSVAPSVEPALVQPFSTPSTPADSTGGGLVIPLGGSSEYNRPVALGRTSSGLEYTPSPVTPPFLAVEKSTQEHDSPPDTERPAPEPEPTVSVDDYPPERCGAIAARVEHGEEDLDEIFTSEKLDAGSWQKVHEHWLDRIREEAGRGRKSQWTNTTTRTWARSKRPADRLFSTTTRASRKPLSEATWRR
ncbi:MAG: DUF2169 domain-containing protein [Polyangiaceae bacterium]|nr:DUF2169 domain-containing protein [Polyangiaceae bacterium]